ncbi:serine hydrolase [Gimesia algae]|uniref:Penicillin-binding protein 4 n=1 Tax=Gimesia algae TaxID=2527971 RepID=A0A517VAZ1_9PLAN|nr:serine hydrolase [Gimesia algae]QDT90149.1 Penicillin-binding protein 4* [Gimesia algae]
MAVRIVLMVCLAYLSATVTAEEPELQLQLNPLIYQRQITRLGKQGFAATDLSVYEGQRSERFALLGVKQKNPKDWKAFHGLDEKQLEVKLKQQATEGYHPLVISGYEKRGEPRFAVILQKAVDANHILKHSLSSDQLQSTLKSLKEVGYAPLQLDGYTVNNQTFHAGIWKKQNDTVWEATCQIPLNQFQNTFDDYTSKGFQLVDLCGFVENGTAVYHAIWSKASGSQWMCQFNLTAEEFQKTNQKSLADDFQLINLDAYSINNQPLFTGIWQKVMPENRVEIPLWKSPDAIPMTGLDQKELASLDEAIKDFLMLHNPPGVAVAVSYRGRLVYARGFGYADKETKELVQPDSQFRIASISKPITAVAIMQLVEQGKLKIDSRVFDVLKQYRRPLSQKNIDPRLKDITIQQLLNHTAGWDREASFDPMFRSIAFAKQVGKPAPAEIDDIIRIMLEQPLDFKPGERYAYSNFGYCLLGRVIEEVSGQSYEDYIQQTICKPLHMNETQLGKTLLDGRKEKEVKYHSTREGGSVFAANLRKQVSSPYGTWYLEAMDSHGGWISSAPDLLRFATAFNIPDRCPVLSAPTISKMLERPPGLAGFNDQGKPKDAYYACGWMVRPIDTAGNSNQWHAGSLEGTSTLLVRRLDRINWAILFNSRQGVDEKRLSSLIDAPMHTWINRIERWPAKDQFKQK